MDSFEKFLLVAPVLLFSMVAHEYAHGYAAMKQGDLTAYQLGRLTWNPIRHIDPFMTILLPIMTFMFSSVVFGGAKPVPVQPRNYRNYKRGDIIVSLAGVVTNVVIAVFCLPVIILIGMIGRAAPALAESAGILQVMFLFGINVNLSLAAFNLIPIPPLDGSHVLKYMLPPAWSLAYQRIGQYGLLVLMAMLTIGRPLLNLWFAPMILAQNAAFQLVGSFMLPNRWM